MVSDGDARNDDRSGINQHVIFNYNRRAIDDERDVRVDLLGGDAASLLRRDVHVRAKMNVVADEDTPASPKHAIGADLGAFADPDVPAS